jgi:hypothetical protein
MMEGQHMQAKQEPYKKAHPQQRPSEQAREKKKKARSMQAE